MRFSRCQRVVLRTVVAVLAVSAVAASTAVAKPRPGKPGAFRLFSAAQNIFTTNRVQCRVFSSGQICATGSSTVGGGIWPRGTADQYVFGSGINVAGVIEAGDKALNGFAGDTAGGFFNNTAGGDNAEEVRPIFSSADPADFAAWPDEARVPCDAAAPPASGPCVDLGLGTDPNGALFDPALQGGIAASQGDLWFMSWEGNPARLESRGHPLGIAVETRALGWNFPSGNEDIIYFLYTFYNVTSTDPNAYAAVRPSLRPVLLQKAADFQALNSAKFGITLPAGGYTINNMFAAFVADMDVAQADANFASVNVPFSMGYTYEHDFSETATKAIGWTFDPAIFGSAPFFNGPGFVGVKYLRSPIDPNTQQQVGLTLFGTFSRSSGSLQDPNDDKQLYRYITGGLTPSDGSCSLANPLQSHICFVNIGSPADMRFFESSGPLNLPPGGQGTIVVAYIFAAPVSVGGCPGPSCSVKPASTNNNLTILGDPVRMNNGVNAIDTVTGYLGNTNGQPRVIAGQPGLQPDPDPAHVTQDEFLVQPGSLLGKALIAQTVFDNRFLLPFAPDRPDFFLVPGDNQVTVLWNRSGTETTPDPFFAVASQPASTLYDPNFRGLDVEGYRIYRGRTNNPSELQLIAQFDYAPSADGKGIFNDFLGNVNPVPDCAPELGVQTGCPIVFSTPAPGTPFTASVPIDLVGTITQVIPGNRVLLANNSAQILPGKLDTAFADINRGRVAQGVSTNLVNGGVPFLYVDHNVRNSLRYFYSVVAFDVNSVKSGPSSLESQRATKAVTPTPLASNQQADATVSISASGRAGQLTNLTVPAIDPTTGTFAGPMPAFDPAAVNLGLVASVSQVLAGPAQLTVQLDSITLGQSSNTGVFGVTTDPIPGTYWMTSAPGTPSAAVFSVPVTPTAGGQAPGAGLAGSAADTTGEGFSNDVTNIDPSVANKFEAAGATFKLSAKVGLTMPSAVYLSAQGLGCNAGTGAGADPGFDQGGNCFYNGGRWFDGPSPATNETKADPNGCNVPQPEDATGANVTCFDNAGQLTGVTLINEPHAYSFRDRSWRNMDWSLSHAARSADFNVYWGAAGLVDSVIDISNDVVVPFFPTAGGGYGILTTANSNDAASFDGRATVLTHSDLACVEPFRSVLTQPALRTPCNTAAPFVLSQTATLGQVAPAPGRMGLDSTAAPAADPGFIFYIAGHTFMMTMPTLPAAGTVWALRTYAGVVNGGNGAHGNIGPYSFVAKLRPFTAIGASATATITPNNGVVAAVNSDLKNVHTVPDPYYVKSAYESSTDQKVLKFVGLPQDAIIRIYSASGVLVRMLEHHGGQYSSTSASQGSEMNWDLRNRNNQVVASGVYFYHVEAGDARRVGRFTVVNFAQ
jgi:hypothetical protein